MADAEANPPISIFGLMNQKTVPTETKTSESPVFTEDQIRARYRKINPITEDEARARYRGLVSDEKSFTGKLADSFFSSDLGKATYGAGRIMNAIGQGASQGWQAGTHYEGELKAWATKTGFDKKFKEQDDKNAKSFNEDFIRPMVYGLLRFPATAVDVLSHYGLAGMGAVQQGINQLGVESDAAAKLAYESPQGKWYMPLAPALGWAGETLPAFASGAYWPEMLPVALPKTRAAGKIGEGEAGYFNTRHPSETQLQERIGAAKEAGIETPPVEPPVTDPNILARRIDPDTFKEWDRLKGMQDDLRSLISKREAELTDDLALGKITSPKDLAKRDASIDYLRDRLTSADERLRDLIPKTADARRRVNELLESDTPEGNMFRDYYQSILLENELRMSKLVDDTRLAEAHAESLLPDPLNSKPGDLLGDTSVSSKSGSVRAETGEKIFADEPPIGHGLVRLYHGASEGSEVGDSARWATTSRLRARDYGKGNNDVYYVDIPQDHYLIQQMKGDKDNGIPGSSHVNLPVEFVKQLKNLKSQVVDQAGALTEHLVNEDAARKVSGVAKKIEAEAIERGMTDGFDNLPEYETMNLKEQDAKISKFVADNYKEAKRIIYTGENPPDGMNPMRFLKGVKARAYLENDAEAVRRLANSNYTVLGSKSAQNLRALGGEDPLDALGIMEDIDRTVKARQEAQTRKTMNEIKKQIDKAIAKADDTFDAFIDSIKCDY